jgi:hypothetical protein
MATKTFDGKGGIEFGFHQGLEEAHSIEEAWYGSEPLQGLGETRIRYLLSRQRSSSPLRGSESHAICSMSEACKNSYVNDLSYLRACSSKRQPFSLK